MRVLFTQAGFGAGGAEKIVAMLAAHRAATGDKVHVAGMTCPPDGSYFPYPSEVVRHVLDDPAPRRAGTLQVRRLLALRQLIRAVEPDVCISFLTKVNVLTLAAAGTRVPVIVSERNNPKAQGAHPAWRRAQNLLMRRAASIVMQTERARLDLPAGLQDRARVIANPCEPLWPSIPRPAGDGRRLVAVGRLDHQKGFDLLIEAMALLRGERPEARLTIFGEGPARPGLERQRDRLGLADAVSLPGLSDDSLAWLRSADILVLSSRFEGFPNVVAEALVNGIPVIAFDCAYGPRELIQHGINGLLVPEQDVAGLAGAMSALIGDAQVRCSMSATAPEICARLNPQRILAEWDAEIARARRRETSFSETPGESELLRGHSTTRGKKGSDSEHDLTAPHRR